MNHLNEAENGSCFMTPTILLSRPTFSFVHRRRLSTRSTFSATFKHGIASPLQTF